MTALANRMQVNEMVNYATISLMLGKELFRKVYPNVTLP